MRTSKPTRDEWSPTPKGRAGGYRLDPGALPLYFLKVSLTLCLFTLAALVCCHLILAMGRP
jgi:hypothetical protein